MNPRIMIKKFYEEIWNKQDKTQILSVFHEDFAFRGSIGQTKKGHKEFAEYLDFIVKALDEYRCDIQETIVEENKAFARVLFSGIHRGEFLGYSPSYKRVEWIGAAVFTFSTTLLSKKDRVK